MVGNRADDEPSALRNLGQGSYELWRACSASKVRVMVRSAASPGGAVVTTLAHGECFLVHKTGPSPAWVRLAPCEHWARDLASPAGYVCVNGKTVNKFELGVLVEHVADDDGEDPKFAWQFSDAIKRVRECGLAWGSCRNPQAMRPVASTAERRLPWLRRWQADDNEAALASNASTAPLCRLAAVLEGEFPANAAECWEPLLKGEGASGGGRCCAFAAVRGGAARATVDGFLAYHFALGVEKILLFFEEPHGAASKDGVLAARRWAEPRLAGPDGLACVCGVHLCDARWWSNEKRFNRLVQLADAKYAGSEAHAHAKKVVDAHSGSGVHARDAAAAAALERANASTGAGASAKDRKLAERRQKDELVGRILAHYQALGQEAPIGLASSDVPALKRHLDHVKGQGARASRAAAVGAAAAI